MTVWQVGVLLYELLTGEVPYGTKTEIIWKKLPRIESDISPGERHTHTLAYIVAGKCENTYTHTHTHTHTQKHDLAL